MDFFCILSALLFFFGNLLKLIYYRKERNRNEVTWEEYKTLDPAIIDIEWEFRIDNKPHRLAAGIINSFAWLVFCIPIFQLAYVLSLQKGSLRSLWVHTSIVVLVLAGACMEWIGCLTFLGAFVSCELLFTDFNLRYWYSDTNGDLLGFRALEVVFIAIRGMQVWIDAFEWIAIFFVMVFVYIGVRRFSTVNPFVFPSNWNLLGLFIGILALLDFLAEVLRIKSFVMFSKIAFIYAGTNRLIFIPLWLIGLGLRLPFATKTIESDANASSPAHEQSAVETEIFN